MAERGRGREERERERRGGRGGRGREREMVISLQGPLRKAGRSLTWSFLINPATVTPLLLIPPLPVPPQQRRAVARGTCDTHRCIVLLVIFTFSPTKKSKSFFANLCHSNFSLGTKFSVSVYWLLLLVRII